MWHPPLQLLFCELGELSLLSLQRGEKWAFTGDGWFAVKYNEGAWRLWLYHWQLVFCGVTHTCTHWNIQTPPVTHWLQHGYKHFKCRQACRPIKLYAHFFSISLYLNSSHSAHLNSGENRTFSSHSSFVFTVCILIRASRKLNAVCLVSCNTTRWPTGWHQTWRCEMSPVGAIVWLEH